MFKIQITGKSGGELDVMTGTTAPLNLSASDIRKPADKKGAWSKTITLAATSNNGMKLGYHFNVNVEKATFDVNKKLAVGLLENEVELEGYFFLQLLSVNKKRGRVVSYDAVVKDEVSDFFTIINGRYLSELDYSDDNHFLTAANVAAKFSATAATSNYKYHLTMNDNEVFDISQFKPAFFLKTMWDRIHHRAAKSYEWAGMNDTDVQFSKWLIPSNVDKAESDTSPLVVATNTSWLRQKTGAGVPPQLFLENFAVSNEVLDVANIYDPVSGEYTSPVVVSAGSSVVFNLKFRYQLSITNNAPNTAKLTAGSPQGAIFVPRVYILNNGSAITQAPIPITGFVNPGNGTIIAAGDTLNVIDSTVNFPISVSGFNAGDILNLAQTLQQNYFGAWIDQVTLGNASITHNVLISDIEMTVSPNAGNGYGFGEWVNMNKFIPQKVKQSEVVAAVMTLNNLIVDKEKSTPSKIVYTKRDAYLDAGAVKDWSLKLDQGQEHDISFIPDLTAKRHILTYKEDKDAANVGYQENTQEIYGQQEYTFKSEFAKEIETTEIVFSPTPCAQLNFGAVVPLYSGKTPGCNIRLLFDGGIKACAPYRIRNYPGNELQITTGYPYVGHFDDPVTPKLDLNFGLCDYYFYPLQTFTNRNMFNLNWRRTMNQIDNGRMLTGMFNLDEYDVKTLRLNDKIFCENEYWNINKVIDYDPNNNGLTKVELISVDDLLKIPTRTIVKPGIKGPAAPSVVSPGVGVSSPIRSIVRKVNGALNSILTLGEVMILGKGNVVGGGVKNAVIVGDDIQAEEDGVYAPAIIFPDGTKIKSADDVTDTNFFTGDQIQDDERLHDAAGFGAEVDNVRSWVLKGNMSQSVSDAILEVNSAMSTGSYTIARLKSALGVIASWAADGGMLLNGMFTINGNVKFISAAGVPTFYLDTPTSGKQFDLDSNVAGFNRVSIVLGSTGGLSSLLTTGGAWNTNVPWRFDTPIPYIYTNGVANGLGLDGGNSNTAAVFIEKTTNKVSLGGSAGMATTIPSGVQVESKGAFRVTDATMYVQICQNVAAATEMALYALDAVPGATNQRLIFAVTGTYVNGAQNVLIRTGGLNRITVNQLGTFTRTGHTFGVATNANATSTLQVAGSIAGATVLKSANYTATISDRTIRVDATATITLPNAVGIDGRGYLIKCLNAGITVTVATTSGQTIDGAATKVLNTQYSFIRVESDGANWIVTG